MFQRYLTKYNFYLPPPLIVAGCSHPIKTTQQEEEVGREQRRRADDAVREAKALRKELSRVREDRTVRFG